MGIYLNSKNPFGQFQDEATATYFIDKSDMLKELFYIGQENSSLGKNNKYICITRRPRRFGKTIMACMIASFLGKGISNEALFRKLKISTSEDFKCLINQHNVIYII